MIGVHLVESEDALAQVIEGARREPVVALDTEAASFHRYVDRVYLVQLSTREGTAIIDPLAVRSLVALGELLADPAVECVFHDADYDLRILDRDYGFRVRGLFDTRVAAQLLGEPEVGLAALLQCYLSVRLSKKFQRADWSRRPLSREMLEYAVADTAHLIPLRGLLRQRLVGLGRQRWAEEEFGRTEAVRWTGPEKQADAHLRLKGAKHLGVRQQVVLGELHRWREGEAARHDRPAFRILPNEALLAIARRLPRNAQDLRAIGELPPGPGGRHEDALLAAVAAGLAVPDHALPRRTRPPRVAPDRGYTERVERLKNSRNRVASDLGLDPGILCSRGVLEVVARAAPGTLAELEAIPDLRRWQVEALGRALLAALAV